MTDSAAFRPVARTPRGMQDRRARDLRAERAILTKVSGVYERYGFEPFDSSALEYADALGKFLPDADRPNEGVFALQDDPDAEGNGEWMALRYDLTAPLARFAAQNWETLPKPFRRYAYGPVWRNEKPGPGRFREFIQCDADTVGSARPEADAEIIAMAVEGLEAIGLPRGKAVLKINHRKLLDGLLNEANIVDERQKLTVLRAIDKLDRIGWAGVLDLLGNGRMDESGAFTPGANLSADAIYPLSILINTAQDDGVSRKDALKRIGNLQIGASGNAAIEEMNKIDVALSGMGIDDSQAFFDPSVVRGLEYYTGSVFEADLTLNVRSAIGEVSRFGSIGGGGRYDDLVARFTGERTPATGFSFGVSRLVSALRAAGCDAGPEARGPVVVIAFTPDDMAAYYSVAAELRAAGIAAEVYLGGSGMRAQMKYADRRLSPAAVMLGGDEIAAGTVTVKDLDLGRNLSREVQDNAAWRAERPGQATIPRAELIPFIRRIVGAG